MPRVSPVVVALSLASVGIGAAQSASAPPNLWLSLRPVDTLASGGALTGAALRRLPIDDPRQALLLVPGVALTSGDIGIGVTPVLTFRGSDATRAAVYVDGVPARFQARGLQNVGIGPHAIEEVTAITGVAPVTFAAAGAGVVAYTTRGGGETVTGDVRWESDEPFGNGASVGFNRIEGGAGGPLGTKLRWFLSGTTYGQRSQYRGVGAASAATFMPAGSDTTVTMPSGESVVVPRFVQWSGACDAATNADVDCQGLLRPLDWSTSGRVLGKLEYRYGSGDSSGMSLTGLAGDLQQRFFPGQAALDPAIYQGQRASSTIGIANWRHGLGNLGGAPAALSVTLSFAAESDLAGPLRAETEAATRDPFLGMAYSRLAFTGLDILPVPLSDQVIRNIRTNSGLRVPFLNRVDLELRQPHRMNPYGMITGWPTSGTNSSISAFNERRWNGRATLDWRPGSNRVNIGLDVERSRVAGYNAGLLSQLFMSAFVAEPTRVGIFASDQISVGDGVLDFGLRYDRINPGGEFPIVPGRIYSNPNWSPNSATSDSAYAGSVARVFRSTRAQGVFAPRLRAAFPIGLNSSLRLGFGRSVELPPWELFFRGANSDLDFTPVTDVFGRDVDLAVSSIVDAGVRTHVRRDVALDLAVYRKTLPAYVSRLTSFADVLNPGDTITVNAITLLSDDHVMGLDASADWTPRDWFRGSVAYSLAREHMTGVGPFGSTGTDVTSHAVVAAIAVQAPDGWGGVVGRDLNAILLVRAASGAPYTRLVNAGVGTVTPNVSGIISGAVNGSRLPWTKQLDLRVAKGMRAGGRDWEVFADFRNLLNFKNVRAVFAETGSVVNDQFRAQGVSGELNNLVLEATSNNAVEPDGTTINLSACSTWSDPVNCVTLTRVERRFGDGNGLYTLAEQQRALNSYYDAFLGSWRFYGSGRTLRVGARLQL